MEGPVVFDVWLEVAEGAWGEARRMLQAAGVALSREAMLDAVRSASGGRIWLPLAAAVPWSEAHAWRSTFKAPATVLIYQSGYSPSYGSRLHQCVEHALRYAGIFGCPVCCAQLEVP
jgi:hypothetical protein